MLVNLSKIVTDLQNNNYASDVIKLNNKGLRDSDIKKILEVLKENTKIKKVILSYNSLSIESAKLIADILKNNNVITEIYLVSNKMNTECARVIAEGLKYNNTLSTLDLSYNKIDLLGISYIIYSLKGNKKLKEFKAEELLDGYRYDSSDSNSGELHNTSNQNNYIENTKLLINKIFKNLKHTSIEKFFLEEVSFSNVLEDIASELEENFTLIKLDPYSSKEINDTLTKNFLRQICNESKPLTARKIKNILDNEKLAKETSLSSAEQATVFDKAYNEYITNFFKLARVVKTPTIELCKPLPMEMITKVFSYLDSSEILRLAHYEAPIKTPEAPNQEIEHLPRDSNDRIRISMMAEFLPELNKDLI